MILLWFYFGGYIVTPWVIWNELMRMDGEYTLDITPNLLFFALVLSLVWPFVWFGVALERTIETVIIHGGRVRWFFNRLNDHILFKVSR